MSHQRHDRNGRLSRRDDFSYWFPLVLTITTAAIGITAWIWSERKEDDDLPPRSPNDHIYSQSRKNSNTYNNLQSPKNFENVPSAQQQTPLESPSYMARMSGALRRTPSPLQIFDGASRSIVEGISAAGAVVGTALGSIIEEDKNAYKDHKTWSEEADARVANRSMNVSSPVISNQSGNVSKISAEPTIPINKHKRKTVAIVISADMYDKFGEGDEGFHGQTSLISYFPQLIDFTKIRLFILIYAPLLKEHPLDSVKSYLDFRSLPKSQDDDALTLSCEFISLSSSLSSSLTVFDQIYSSALNLTEKDTMVLPFTTFTGHVQILRHLHPDIVYLEESLSGTNGEVINNLQTWLRQDIVLVISIPMPKALVDENEKYKKKEQWWKSEDRVGKKRGVIVLEASRVGDDWVKRVESTS